VGVKHSYGIDLHFKLHMKNKNALNLIEGIIREDTL